MSLNALNEPNSDERKILAKLNKTVEGLFREVAYKLNVDYEFYITLWFYEEDYGWKGYKGKMLEGDDNYIKVGVNIRRPVPSTDQALPSSFYFRIS